MSNGSPVTRDYQPIILIRGFGGLSVGDERRIAYQGFNEGSVYPQKRGENYIYEGFVLRLMKDEHAYGDATNIVSYFDRPVPKDAGSPTDPLAHYWSGGKVVADRELARRLMDRASGSGDPRRTFWVFRYYDLDDREFAEYGAALRRLIDMVRDLTAVDGKKPKVNVVAHSMGGLIVREAIQSLPEDSDWADESINKIVTLGTPHQGVAFQVLGDLRWLPGLRAGGEIAQFDPEMQNDATQARSFHNFGRRFPLERVLCVVGTDFRSYSVQISSLANRIFSLSGEYGLNYNRSDGLVKQAYAHIPGAHRTFVHKCHGGGDSLMTARESYEVASRFFFGDIRVRVRLVEAKVKRKLDTFGKSEIFFGLQVKSRRLDFDLFHQSAPAQNCYGPFRSPKLDDPDGSVGFPWLGPDRLIWQGFLNSRARVDPDVVLRAGVYVSERDLRGSGFSDNIIFNKQYFIRALFDPMLRLEIHDDQDFQRDTEAERPERRMDVGGDGWTFPIGDRKSFTGRLKVELDFIPLEGDPQPLRPGMEVDQERDGARFQITGVR